MKNTEFRENLREIFNSGNLDKLSLCLKNNQDKEDDIIEIAMKYGYHPPNSSTYYTFVETAIVLIDNIPNIDKEKILCFALQYDRNEVVGYFAENKVVDFSSTSVNFLKITHDERNWSMVEYLLQQGVIFHDICADLLLSSLKWKKFEIAKYLIDNDTNLVKENVLCSASKMDYIDIVKYLV
jgi:hypothetical protein